jgi:lysozyme family protein
MSDQTREELKELRGQVRVLADTIEHYRKLFAEDGNIDAAEQTILDQLSAKVTKVEALIDKKEETLGFGDAILNKSSEIAENVGDFLSKKDDIVDHSLVDSEAEKEEEATPENSTEDNDNNSKAEEENNTVVDDNTNTDDAAASIVGSVIKKSVGEKGDNIENDVKIVQKLLEVAITGDCDKKTILAIKKFQLSIGFKSPDGLIGAGGTTWKALSGGKVDVLSDQEIDDLIDTTKVKAILGSVHASEGGYVDDPDDPGGKTKYGIAEHGEWSKFAAMFGLDANNTALIKDITKDQVDEYYIRTRLAPLGIPNIKSTKISNALFDQSILTPGIVKRSMRRSLNKSGHKFPENSNDNFSAEELEAINKGDETKILEGFVEYQNAYYISLNNSKYEKGWLNRTARLLSFTPPVEEEDPSSSDEEEK